MLHHPQPLFCDTADVIAQAGLHPFVEVVRVSALHGLLFRHLESLLVDLLFVVETEDCLPAVSVLMSTCFTKTEFFFIIFFLFVYTYFFYFRHKNIST